MCETGEGDTTDLIDASHSLFDGTLAGSLFQFKVATIRLCDRDIQRAESSN
jgi:hypothetical protein